MDIHQFKAFYRAKNGVFLMKKSRMLVLITISMTLLLLAVPSVLAAKSTILIPPDSKASCFKCHDGWPAVSSKPGSDFTASKPISGNAPLTIRFVDNSTGTPTSWKWNLGDGTTSTERYPVHTYTKPGKYTISLTVANKYGSDSSTRVNFITVTGSGNKAPVALFTAAPASGTAPLKVKFTDKSANLPTSWKWSFGDGTSSTAKNPVHTYTKPGKYTVSLTATNKAGTNTVTKTNLISVNTVSKPVANFAGAAQTSGYAPLTVKFADKSTGSPTSWKWSFGDGKYSTTKNPVHTYTKPGKYTVRLTVHNSAGTSTLEKPAYISVGSRSKAPVTAFTANHRTGKAPLKVQFLDRSTNKPVAWKWSFGDGTYSNLRNPVHTYTKPGKYTVGLTTKNASGMTVANKPDYVIVS